MAKVFITYGNDNYKNSLKRIRKQAKKLKLFDKIIIYKPSDLPDFIKASPLFAFDRLGGYCVWKSYIIYKTYNDCSKGDIIVYADAGCTLNMSDEWNSFFNLIKQGDTLLFQYRKGYNYNWEQAFGKNATVRSGNWIKRSVYDYFSPIFNNSEWLEIEKLWGGALFVSKGEKENQLLKNWFCITLLNPELSFDVYGNELENQYDTFVEHRHDQALLGILSSYFKNKQVIHFISETSESSPENAAISATRLKDIPPDSLFVQMNKKIKTILGIKNWNFLKKKK